uniref:Transcription initiation factor IIF subunit alpha n=1 Tax=Lactuca sativa TaxID=4236 RepID=A0A9R1XBF9_LACSA|nr:hypothetical protein LSAT_V11C500252590 [Lactuca sativa]
MMYNFNKVAQYKQLTLEEAEEKIKNRRKTVDGYERWMMKAANSGAAAFGEVERPDDKEGGGGGGGGRGRKKNNVDDDEGNVSDRGEEDEDEEFARKNRLGHNKRGGDDDEEGPRGGDLDFDDDDIEKRDEWEHEEIFTDDDEEVSNDLEEREDLLAPKIPDPPEIKQIKLKYCFLKHSSKILCLVMAFSHGSRKHPQLVPSTPRWVVADDAGVILILCDEEVARYETATLTAAVVPALLLPPPTTTMDEHLVVGLPALETYARLFHRYYAIASPSATQRLLLGLLKAPPSWAPDALDVTIQLVDLLRAVEDYAFGMRVLVDMIRLPDWVFESVDQEMRVIEQDATPHHPGIYLSHA